MIIQSPIPSISVVYLAKIGQVHQPCPSPPLSHFLHILGQHPIRDLDPGWIGMVALRGIAIWGPKTPSLRQFIHEVATGDSIALQGREAHCYLITG